MTPAMNPGPDLGGADHERPMRVLRHIARRTQRELDHHRTVDL